MSKKTLLVDEKVHKRHKVASAKAGLPIREATEAAIGEFWDGGHLRHPNRRRGLEIPRKQQQV